MRLLLLNPLHLFHRNAGKQKRSQKIYLTFFSSRYVLITFPKLRTRYNIPTSVERLLLPERFPVLFQNILQHSDHDQNHK